MKIYVMWMGKNSIITEIVSKTHFGNMTDVYFRKSRSEKSMSHFYKNSYKFQYIWNGGYFIVEFNTTLYCYHSEILFQMLYWKVVMATKTLAKGHDSRGWQHSGITRMRNLIFFAAEYVTFMFINLVLCGEWKLLILSNHLIVQNDMYLST